MGNAVSKDAILESAGTTMHQTAECVRHGASAARARVALFDFDGTISTIRSGWIDVMAPMMVELLVELQTGESNESEADLDRLIHDMIWRTTGKETIYQMMDFAAEVSTRGGAPREPMEYKKMHLDRLWPQIGSRVEHLKEEQGAPGRYLVPGAGQPLRALRRRGHQI